MQALGCRVDLDLDDGSCADADEEVRKLALGFPVSECACDDGYRHFDVVQKQNHEEEVANRQIMTCLGWPRNFIETLLKCSNFIFLT